ncbi:8-oxo-dGTP diphosphatase [Amycolatopsis lexingtonensis]|uniref:8-oxo-dGTP diphosphatase n=1 Tax=Amycolatopsis lexingtonensis TaxID=218822 RepID=A0ABR9IHM2_9PSEU|nr:NUDIX domain-containing protein [Amycolatopsis lexingtonensis]MBE1502664.1 8-oxo-dGTP diphosphatase [Amycolatopsis lexingtonensis]
MSWIGSLAAKIAARFDDRSPVFYAADMAAFTHRRGEWHVLLIRRRWRPHRGKLALPGGHVEARENSVDAAVRELWEETGIVVPADVVVRLVGVFDEPGRDSRGHYVSAAYGVILPGADDPVAADDATEADWIPVRVALRAAARDGLAFDHDGILAGAITALDLYGPRHR